MNGSTSSEQESNPYGNTSMAPERYATFLRDLANAFDCVVDALSAYPGDDCSVTAVELLSYHALNRIQLLWIDPIGDSETT